MTETAALFRWELPASDPIRTAAFERHLACPPAVARIIADRGIDDTKSFLSPSLADLHDPNLLLGLPEAVARIERALGSDEPVLIYGDYDVDGTTATVLLKTAIERVAPPGHPAKVTYHVPHRIREGYGMQTKVLGEAALTGIRLVISVDTGIRAFAAADEAKALGLDLIVTDHHLPDDVSGLPDALAVINPAQPNCPYPNKSLCGAAVAFKLAHALLTSHALRQPDPSRALDLLNSRIIPSFLKLVAIATIADSVPLIGENRAIAWLGLRELANPVQPGLRALMQVAKLPLDQAPTAMEVGFRLAPRINAAGRMDVAGDVVELLLTRDAAKAQMLAEKLDQLNQDRRATEAQALAAIDLQLAALKPYAPECIILDHADWHRGVLGILASRIVERTNRPALVLTHQDGQAHGSGRSIEGFHLLDALTAVDAPALFTKFGGHAHAVGLTIPSESLDELRHRMRLHATLHLTTEVLTPVLHCDAEIPLAAVDQTLYQWLQRLEPFGNAFPEPIFISRDLILTDPIRILKEKHVCLRLRDSNTSHAPFEALGWTRTIDWVAHTEGLEAGSRIDIAYRLRTSTYQQINRLQLELVDLKSTSMNSYLSS
ncbi:exonuclease RecJ [Granulicella pectinivorans]|uniref:Single-stranded-DNA-specific exonuclease RecJ n=1 Tax=Granulicella pectinivorans TaxID=474950 RepID=A0A1I6MMR0_9BACT|nr:single-stranded-DNA-specific exonuclease RecJ [Granulicella pectinivorans]SFS16887.1 exonuclease RecJ [Granulicella pectinivorans]